MSNELDGCREEALVGVRAKTSPPVASRSGQFPGVRRFRRSRWARVTGPEDRSNCYHVMSRITDGLEFFDETEKEALALLIWKMAAFCKVKVLTYCVMGNHFHVLVEVPAADEQRAFFRDTRVVDGEEIGWSRLFRHLRTLYSKGYVSELQAEIAKYRKLGDLEQVEEIREAFLKRIADLSKYVREVKERFTRWCNKYRGRRGSLWQGKFKSVIVEGDEFSGDDDSGMANALQTMAVYIDLNPVRAGLVDDPKRYRWCGFSEAVRGSKRARIGIARITGQRVYGWKEDQVETAYQDLLKRNGFTETGREPGSEQGSTTEVIAQGESTDLSREVVKSFSKGLALGSAQFVEDIFDENRILFGPRRKRGRKRSGVKRLYSLRE